MKRALLARYNKRLYTAPPGSQVAGEQFVVDAALEHGTLDRLNLLAGVVVSQTCAAIRPAFNAEAISSSSSSCAAAAGRARALTRPAAWRE